MYYISLGRLVVKAMQFEDLSQLQLEASWSLYWRQYAMQE